MRARPSRCVLLRPRRLVPPCVPAARPRHVVSLAATPLPTPPPLQFLTTNNKGLQKLLKAEGGASADLATWLKGYAKSWWKFW